MYIRFHEAPCHESDEVRPGVIVDYDQDGRVIGLETLDVSEHLSPHFVQSVLHDRIRVEIDRKAMVA